MKDSERVLYLTAASMLAPLVGPAGSPWDLPALQEIEPIRELRESRSVRAGYRWVLARYAHDRRAHDR